MHGAAATDEHVAGKIGDDADASLQNENKCVGGDGEGVPDVLNNTKHKGVVGNDEAEPDKSVGDEPNGAGEVVPSANATQQSGIDKKKRSTRKRLKQAVARVADHETAHEQPVWLLQSDDNIDGSDFAWVEWGNGQKQLIPKSRISSEEVEEISSQPRRTRGSREGAHKGNKGAPKEKRARSVRGRKRAKRVSSSNNSPSSLSSHSEGTSVDHSSLSTGSRVLVVSKGSQFKATIRKRRHENNRHEFLIHYDGNKKTTVHWIQLARISDVLDDDDVAIVRDDAQQQKENADSCDDASRFSVGTAVSKVFYDEYEGKERPFSGEVTGYDADTKLYSIFYEDGDDEEMEERQLSKHVVCDDNEPNYARQEKEDAVSCDDASRFSYKSNPDEGDDERSKKTNENAHTQTSHIQQSCGITRKKLHCLTGGICGGYKNPLNVGTPMGFCGGRAFATKDGRVHHICIKEEKNHPLPISADEEFLLYRIAKNRGTQERDIRLLNDSPGHPPIPIFWEPTGQPKNTTKIVKYVGHWKIANIDDFSRNPVKYMGEKRCALIKFKFARFDQRWTHIMQLSRGKTEKEIASMNWDGIGDGDEHHEAEEGKTLNPASDEMPVGRGNVVNTLHNDPASAQEETERQSKRQRVPSKRYSEDLFE